MNWNSPQILSKIVLKESSILLKAGKSWNIKVPQKAMIKTVAVNSIANPMRYLILLMNSIMIGPT